jgi:HK97 family phage prohead protease
MEEKTFPFEINALTDEGTFEGYAAIFDTPDAMGEVVERGAFTKTLQEGKTRPMCWYHDTRQPMGIVELSVDEKGLKVKGEFDLNVQIAREKHSLMKKKAIRGISFGFKTIKDAWEGTTRRLKEIKLFEVSPVTFGAHPEALVTSVKQWTEEKPYPNEHSARIKSPDLFDDKTFKRTADGTIYGKVKVPATADVLWAKLKGSAKPSDNPIPQAIRFPTENWTVAQAKKWLKDNNVTYEKFEAASKSFEGAIEFLEEIKSGQEVPAARVKLIDNAVLALSALLETSEPPEGTQEGGKGLFAPIFEVLERPEGTDKPHEHLFGSTIKSLENPNNKEK